ncbi:hypothetical protein Dimus_039005 [Dionaea muscipula]
MQDTSAIWRTECDAAAEAIHTLEEDKAASMHYADEERKRANELAELLEQFWRKRDELALLLPLQLNFLRRTVVREFVASEEFLKLAAPVASPMFTNGFNLCKLRIRRALEAQGLPVDFLGGLVPHLDLDFDLAPEVAPILLAAPQWREEAGPSDPLAFVHAWLGNVVPVEHLSVVADVGMQLVVYDPKVAQSVKAACKPVPPQAEKPTEQDPSSTSADLQLLQVRVSQQSDETLQTPEVVPDVVDPKLLKNTDSVI